MPRGTSNTEASREAVKTYLREVVGIGGYFRMTDLRTVDPDANQIDRRMRELREVGWVINSNRADPTLKPGVYQFVKEGDGVKVRPPINDRQRRAVFERDGYRCKICNTLKGEPYADDPTRVCRLTVGHLQAGNQGGASELKNYRTECARCNEPVRDRTVTPPTIEEIVIQARNLNRAEKQELVGWLHAGHRNVTDTEVVWARLATLPPEYADAVKEELEKFK